MTDIDPNMHEELKREIVGRYDRVLHLYDRVGIKPFIYCGNLLIDRLNIQPGACFWVKGMSPEGLEKFKKVSFENLKAMKG